MVRRVAMLEAKVLPAYSAGNGHQFLFLAVPKRATIGVDLLLLRAAKLIDMGAHGYVRRYVTGRGNRFAAQWANRHLDVLAEGRRTGVGLVAEVLRAENCATSIALHRQEIELVAELFRAVLAQVGKLHFRLSSTFNRTSRTLNSINS